MANLFYIYITISTALLQSRDLRNRGLGRGRYTAITVSKLNTASPEDSEDHWATLKARRHSLPGAPANEHLQKNPGRGSGTKRSGRRANQTLSESLADSGILWQMEYIQVT